MKKHRNIILKGRTYDLFRIDYDPANTDITGITSRLYATLARNSSDSALEFLLNPLVMWNKAPFPELGHKDLLPMQNGNGACYQSQWLFRQKIRNTLQTLTGRESKKAAGLISSSYRTRCHEVDRSSLLLLKPSVLVDEHDEQRVTSAKFQHAIKWNLYNNRVGFALKLMACFKGPDRTAEEYEDLLERCMYSFMLANKTAVRGPKAITKGLV